MTEAIPNQLKTVILNALEKLKDQSGQQVVIPEFLVEPPPAQIRGDFATNVALVLAKKLSRPPQQIANEIVEKIPRSSGIIDKIEIQPPGFINFFLARQRLYKELEAINARGDSYGKQNLGNHRGIQIEFVSANPTGPLHIGHGRGAVIGDTLANILETLGWRVEREYYINDVGKQIDILEESVRKAGKKITRNQNNKFYQGDYIKEIAREYSFTGKQRDLREFVLSRILKDIQQDLNEFGVQFDNWFSEKQLYANYEVEKIVDFLKSRRFICEKDGAWWFKATLWKDTKDRVVRRKNGQWTYFAADLAYLKNKFDRGYDEIINIWGSDHHGYEPRMKAGAEALGYNPANLKIILYQLVKLSRRGKPITMSTRKGEFVTLKEVVQEVGRDATRFFLLMRRASSQLDFDLELAKSQSLQNPVYYVQYGYARISSIFKEKDRKGFRSSGSPDFTLLKEEEELKLLKDLAFYPYIVELCGRQLEPHFLTGYLQKLAGDFHRYYDKYRVLSSNEPLTQARIALVKGVGIVVKNALKLMGIAAPEKM